MQRFEESQYPIHWKSVLEPFFASATGQELLSKLASSIQGGKTIFPPDPFYALRLIKPSDVHVVILGQDPYHEQGEATGLAFSVPAQRSKLPPSLKNIFKEIAREYEDSVQTNGDLSSWAKEGVLLLNATLTVEEGRANAHAKWGWTHLTDAIIAHVLEKSNVTAFALWGNFAQAKEAFIRNNSRGNLLILKSNHPSPLSASRPPVPFVGCGHFKQINDFLVNNALEPIRWNRNSEISLF